MLPETINYGDHEGLASSLLNPTYTVSNSKYSCVKGMYFAHVTFCYLVFLSGLACLITRCLPPRIKRTHAWFGRIFIMSMLWATATSILINNSGLPLSNLISFGFMNAFLSIGWVIIVVHRSLLQAAALKEVDAQLAHDGSDFIKPADGNGTGTLAAALQNATARIVERQSFVSRFVSLKTAHGALFFVSWFNIAGRIFASNQTGDFTCHTYPVYKPIATKIFNGSAVPLTLVPNTDPNYDRLPWARVGGDWAWNAITVLGALIFSLIVLAFAAWFGARRSQRKLKAEGLAERSATPTELSSSDVL